MTDFMPDYIHTYRVLRELGSGGMGRVLLVENPQGQRLALKHIHAKLLHQSNYAERFQREMMLMTRLSHPNLMPLLDRGMFGNLPYYVMPYVDGLSIRDYLRGYGAFTPEQAYPIVDGVCEALTYLHAHGVYHRDIKPHNILIDRRGTPYLTDFGIAADTYAAEALTSTFQRAGMGTEGYVAPELRGGAVASARTDVFSLGMTVYEMFAREPLYRVFSQNVPDPFAVLPDALRPVILRAIDQNPATRYPTVSAFQQGYRAASLAAPYLPNTPAPVQMPDGEAPTTHDVSPVPPSSASSGGSSVPVYVNPPPRPQPAVPPLLIVAILITVGVLVAVVMTIIQGQGAVATQIAAQNTATAIAAVPLTETQYAEETVIFSAATAAATQATATQAAVTATQGAGTAAADAQAAQPQDVPAVGEVFYVQRETGLYAAVAQAPREMLSAGDLVRVQIGTAPRQTYYDTADDRFFYATSLKGPGWINSADLGPNQPSASPPPPTPAVPTTETEPTQPPPPINNFTSGSVAVTTAQHRTDDPTQFFLMPELGSTQPFLVLSPGATVTSTGQRNWGGGQWWWQVAVETDEGTKTGWLEDSSLTAASAASFAPTRTPTPTMTRTRRPTRTPRPTSTPYGIPAVGDVYYVQRGTNVYASAGGRAVDRIAIGTSVTITTGRSHSGALLTYYDGADGRYFAIIVGGRNVGWVRADDLGTTRPRATAVSRVNTPTRPPRPVITSTPRPAATHTRRPFITSTPVVIRQAASSAFRVGQRAQLTEAKGGQAPFWLREAPSSPRYVEAWNLQIVTIIDESQWVDGQVWWRVRTEDGVQGWVEEYALTASIYIPPTAAPDDPTPEPEEPDDDADPLHTVQEQTEGWVAWRPFEDGVMMWFSGTNQIWAFFDNGSNRDDGRGTVAYYPDTYNGTENPGPTNCDIIPDSGIGKVYFDYNLENRLGCTLNEDETTFIGGSNPPVNGRVQIAGPGATLYEVDWDSGTWQTIRHN